MGIPDGESLRSGIRASCDGYRKSASAGDCTLAAQRLATRLKIAGYPDADLHGSDPKAKAILMLAHIDVVEAKREDWTRDPFTLIEEGGYFYGRGTSNMKAQAAVWVATLLRFKREGYKPDRDLILALTADEEGGGGDGPSDPNSSGDSTRLTSRAWPESRGPKSGRRPSGTSSP